MKGFRISLVHSMNFRGCRPRSSGVEGIEPMRIPGKCILVLLLACSAVLLSVVPVLSLDDAATVNKAVFFSQGQAVDASQDHAKSRQEAVFDFLSLAVTQAMSRFLSPSEMASMLPALQETVLKQPERYVETYQIFSENSVNGLYRVTGQVTVVMDVLRTDLNKSGLPVSAERNEDRAEDALDVNGEREAGTTGEAPASVEASSGQAGESVREPVGENRDLFWAVTEKWDQEWNLPADTTNPQSLFAAAAAQELEDFGWSLRFPGEKSFAIDHSGDVSTGQVLARAEEMKSGRAVIGAVSLRHKQGEGTRLNAALRVLSVPSGKSAGEIRKELTVEEGSNQEAAMALAAAISPQLDRLLDGASQAGPSSGTPRPGGSPGPEASSTNPPASNSAAPGLTPAPPAPEGAWVLKIMARQQFPAWQEMEKLLREHFKSMQVKGLQFGVGEIVAILEGVDAQFFSSLNGNRFPGGDTVQLDALSPEERSVKVTISPREIQEAGPKQ